MGKRGKRQSKHDDSTLEAIWTVNSETGERHLLDLKTGEDITPKDTK